MDSTKSPGSSWQGYVGHDIGARLTFYGIDRCCANAERAKHKLLQPRPCPGGLVFHAGGLPLRPLRPPFYSEQILSAFHSVPGVFYSRSCLRSSDLLSEAFPTCLDFSIVDTFAHSRVPSEHPYSPRFGSHFFRDGDAPTLLPHGCRGKRVRFVELHHHQSTLLAGLHCQHRRVLASIDAMKGHQFMRELFRQHAE